MHRFLRHNVKSLTLPHKAFARAASARAAAELPLYHIIRKKSIQKLHKFLLFWYPEIVHFSVMKCGGVRQSAQFRDTKKAKICATFVLTFFV